MSNDEKKGRGEKAAPANDHNSKEREKYYVSQILEIADQITDLNGELKDILNEAKGEGFSKMELRKAAKFCRMTEEALQSKKEVDLAAQRIFEELRDSGAPLFRAAA